VIQAEAPRLVLASASPARRALLSAAGLQFDAVAADVDEAAVKRAMQADGASADAAALALAAAKAQAVALGGLPPGSVVIGADQILVCNGEWYDKPGDADAVMEHLLRLRGHAHTLVTAVSCWQDGALLWQEVSRPVLTMRAFSVAFLEAYLAMEAGACCGCVGGYRFEGVGKHLFDRVEGEEAAILGLPMLPLLGFLRHQGVIIG